MKRDSSEFQSVWTLAASGSPFNMNVGFCYSDSELTTSGVTDENTIVVYHLINGAWQAQTTATDPANNCVTVSNVTSLSPWTIVGDGNLPTAIELQNLTVRAVKSKQSLVLLFAALLGLALGWVLLRLRR